MTSPLRMTRALSTERGFEWTLIRFLRGCVGVGFDDDVDFCAWFEASFVAVVVDDDIFDADLTVKFFAFLHMDLRFFDSARNSRLDHFLNPAMHLALLLHEAPRESTRSLTIP